MNSIETETVLKKWQMEHAEIGLGILFGSHAKGTPNKYSDVDFAIQLTSGHCLQAADKLAYIDQLTGLLNVSIDLVDLRTVGQPLLAQIMKYGKLLIGSQALYANLAIRNVNSSQDFSPYIERMLADRRKRWLADG